MAKEVYSTILARKFMKVHFYKEKSMDMDLEFRLITNLGFHTKENS